MMEHIGEETYEQGKNLAGRRCLVILERLDEMAAEHQAIIMITSRPHVCEKLDADRRVEVVGFSKEEIYRF